MLNTKVAHPARIWDYWLGGKDNYAADREAAAEVNAVMPIMPVVARAGRQFLGTVVSHLTADAGIRQFLDIGTGLPTADNTHQVAQRIAPEARIVYADNDPIVLAHARALLVGHALGATDYIDADLRDTGGILAAAAGTLDFGRPVAIMLLAILHFIPDDDDPAGIVRRLMEAVPAGSYLALSHAAADISADVVAAGSRRYNTHSSAPITPRTEAQVAGLVGGLDIVDPGIVPLGRWRPGASSSPATLPTYCVLARKP
jgi:hypothetical protein